MPKSFIYTARDYRDGNYYGGKDYDRNVMTTRSGLSILKVSSDIKPVSNPVPQISQKEDRTSVMKKRHRLKHRSMNHMSFVTRFHLCRKVPGLEIPGICHRESVYFSDICYFSEVADDDDDTDTDDDGDSDDVSDDENDGACLDDFILTVAEDMNNNQSLSVSEILEKKEEWEQNHKDFSTRSKRDSCPLSNYFASNRLAGNMLGNRSSSEKSLDVKIDNLNQPLGIKSETIRKDIVKYELSTSSDVDSEDTTSSIYSDGFCDIDTATLLQGEQDGENPLSQTKLLKLRDTQMKIQFVNVHGEEVIKCGQCDKVFALMSAYMTHLRTHMKAKSTCFLCGKVFSRSWLLKGHLRTHTGEKPFMCPQDGCNKSFADKSNLRSHMLIHNVTRKDHKCEKCGRTFAQKRYLHKHMQEVCRVFL